MLNYEVLANLHNFRQLFFDRFSLDNKFYFEKKDINKNTQFSPLNLAKSHNHFFLDGNFESEKYFDEYRNDLLKEFTLKNKDRFSNNRYLDIIKKNNVVSICVRQNRFSERRSNISDHNQKRKSEQFTKSTINYIKRSVNYIDQKIDNAKYLVWSNDFSNLREYFPSEKFTFVDIKENKSLSDFYLLLNCKNFIVGPTSFHWWPAWLNSRENSIIIRPKDIDISNNSDFWPNKWTPL